MKNMNEKQEDHHVTPICMLGDDFSENIVKITESEHKLIHSVLDIPYYKLRRFRKATNHMVHRNSQQFVNRLRNLHLEYFKNSDKLPIKLQNIQRDSIRATTKRIIKAHNIIVKLPKDNTDLFSWLRAFHNVLVLR